MRIEHLFNAIIAVLLLAAILLCPSSTTSSESSTSSVFMQEVANDTKQTTRIRTRTRTTIIKNMYKEQQHNNIIDNRTIDTVAVAVAIAATQSKEQQRRHQHHRTRRNVHAYDPLMNPWLHSKHELLELLWKKGNELENNKDDIRNINDHQLNIDEHHHHYHHHQHHQMTMPSSSTQHQHRKHQLKKLHNTNRLMNNNKEQQVIVGKSIDCCPSILEMVEPYGGTNINGTYVALYQDGNVKQRFYELSCDRQVEGRPCLFMDRKLYNMSKCVQKYSYSYALVRENNILNNNNNNNNNNNSTSTIISSSTFNINNNNKNSGSGSFNNGGTDGAGGSGWMLDYIRVRSGCSCEVTPVINKKKRFFNNNNKKNKLKKHN